MINLVGENLFHPIDVVKVIWFVLEGDMFPLEVLNGDCIGVSNLNHVIGCVHKCQM